MSTKHDAFISYSHSADSKLAKAIEQGIERLAKPAAVTGIITTPWRVVLIGDNLNALVNSDVIHNLCPPPDSKLFPQGMHTDWIKPGRAVWKYLDGGGANTRWPIWILYCVPKATRCG